MPEQSLYYQRIREIRKERKLSIQAVADLTGLSKSAISMMETGTSSLSTQNLISICEALGANIGWVMTGRGAKHEDEAEKEFSYSEQTTPPVKANDTPSSYDKREARPLVVTIDNTQKEVITLVPIKARAGYLTGYKDPEFVSELPAYSLPGFTNATYRMFEVQGYSMYQELNKSGLRPGDIVVCQYVERAMDIRDGRVYVVVNHDDILIKRCINRLGSDQKLILKSDNLSGEYPDIVLGPDEIAEVWEFKANITRHVPPPSDTYKMINNMSAQLAILMDEYNRRQRQLAS